MCCQLAISWYHIIISGPMLKHLEVMLCKLTMPSPWFDWFMFVCISLYELAQTMVVRGLCECATGREKTPRELSVRVQVFACACAHIKQWQLLQHS